MSMKLDSKTFFGTENCKIDLYPFQASCVQWMKMIEYNAGDSRYMTGGILANDMGMGKTPTFSMLVASTPVPSTLILTTSSTRYEWVKNILLSGFSAHVYTIDEGPKIIRCTMEFDENGAPQIVPYTLSKRKGEDIIEPCVLICNYQLVTTGTVNNKIISERVWYRIGIDEAAFLRNQNDSWQKLNSLKQPMVTTSVGSVRLGSRWCITGTPIQNNGNHDLANIFRWIDDRFLRGSFEKDWTNELRYLISNNLYRINREQITPLMKKLMKYPENEPIIENVVIPLPESDVSAWLQTVDYNTFANFINTGTPNARYVVDKILSDERCFLIAKIIESIHVSRSNNNPGKRLSEENELRTMISYPYNNVPIVINHLYGSDAKYTGKKSKFEFLAGMLMQNKSIVCFHRFVPVSDKIEEFVKTNFPHYTVHRISGATKSDFEKHNIVEKCNNLIKRNQPVILLSSTQSTAEGMNYQMFSNLIMFDHEYNQKTDEQAKSRVQRIGQENQVYIYELAFDKVMTFYGEISIDKRIQDIRDSRKHLSDIIDQYNAAFSFKRYTTEFQDITTGATYRDTGVYFGDYWEKQMRGSLGGPDSVGPDYIR